MTSKQTNNPYAKAASAYGDHSQKHTPNQRELEARVLLKSARMIKELQDSWDVATPEQIETILRYNRQIWLVFYDTAMENPDGDKPKDIRSNIINLANFIFKREVEIMSDKDRKKEKLDVLININKEIAAGLMSTPQTEQTPQTSE